MPSKTTAKATKPVKKSLQIPRSANKTQTCISLGVIYLEWARMQAKAEGRGLSNWIERLIVSEMNAEKPGTKGQAK